MLHVHYGKIAVADCTFQRTKFARRTTHSSSLVSITHSYFRSTSHALPYTLPSRDKISIWYMLVNHMNEDTML